MNFLYACDDYYAPFAGISITSLFESNRELSSISVYVLGNGIGEENKVKFIELANRYDREVVLVDAGEIEKYLEDIGLRKFGPAGLETYYRLFADKVLPKDVKRIVYLDCDVIVLGNLSELDELIFDDNTCCAMARSTFFRYYCKYIGLGENDIHFQAGVCVYDVDKWKRIASPRIEELFRQGITYMRMHDMDILNITVNKNTTLLPAKYNVVADWNSEAIDDIYRNSDAIRDNFYSEDEIACAIKDTKILHFCGYKPWISGMNIPRSDEWEKYKLMSPWKNTSPLKFNLGSLRRVDVFLSKIFPNKLYQCLTGLIHGKMIAHYYRKHDHFAKLDAYREATLQARLTKHHDIL